jgi:hypothetical protein
MQVVVVDGKDEKVTAEADDLLHLIWGDTVPPALQPPKPPAASRASVNGTTSAAAAPAAASTRSGRVAAPAAPVTAPSGMAMRLSSRPGAAAEDGAETDGHLARGTSLQRSEAAFLINAVYEEVPWLSAGSCGARSACLSGAVREGTTRS